MRKSTLGFVFVLALFLSAMSSQVVAYDSDITVTGADIAFDIYHEGYHTTAAELDPIIGNFTEAGNNAFYINETWELAKTVDALFLTGSQLNFTNEQADIKKWLEAGEKFIFASSDSDYGGSTDYAPLNDLLDYIGTQIRFASISVEEPVLCDSSAYRAAATVFGDSEIALTLTMGMYKGFITHGPTAIIGYDGTDVVDIRTVAMDNVSVIVSYSANASAADSDTSETPFDYYATVGGGFYPAVVYEYLVEYDSHLILASEAIYSYYKQMYNDETEKGAYNNGLTYGRLFVNNIINHFIKADSGKAPFSFAFAIIPLIGLGVIYTIVRRRK